MPVTNESVYVILVVTVASWVGGNSNPYLGRDWSSYLIPQTSPWLAVVAVRGSEIGILKHLAHFDCEETPKRKHSVPVFLCFNMFQYCLPQNFWKIEFAEIIDIATAKTDKEQKLDHQSLTNLTSAFPSQKTSEDGSAIFSHKIHRLKQKQQQLRELTLPASRQLQSFWWPWKMEVWRRKSRFVFLTKLGFVGLIAKHCYRELRSF